MSGGGSFWLEDVGPIVPRAPLPGDVDADVTIVGGGYTGLWAAWYLAARDPSLRIVVCEAEVAGFGASGRNGGWCVANIGVTPGELRRRFGQDALTRTWRALRDTVDEVGRVDREAGLGAGWDKVGVLRVARGAQEVEPLRASWQQLVELGLHDGASLLSAEEVASRVAIADARGALHLPDCAVVHPGRLVRGLADAVERRGVTLHEHTAVTAVTPGGRGSRPIVHTDRGRITSDAVLLAGEAYLTRLPGLRRRLLPVYSLVVLTEPLSRAQREAIGWRGRECLSSHRLTVDYLSQTADGRVLFGGRGAPYRFGSAIDPRFDRHAPTHAHLRRSLLEWFPALEGIRVTHEWGGPLGMPRDFMPSFSFNPATGIGGAFGYTGQGVAAANLAGRTLADLVTGERSDLTQLPMVGHRPRRWEPEPLRFLGARVVQHGLDLVDRRARRSGKPPTGRSLPERLIKH